MQFAGNDRDKLKIINFSHHIQLNEHPLIKILINFDSFQVNAKHKFCRNSQKQF